MRIAHPATFRNGLWLLREPKLGIRLYKNMVLARMFERRLIRLAQENKLQWPIYPSYGQEACGIGVSAAAAERDLFLLTLNYRVIPYVVGRNVGLQKYTDAFFHCLPAPDSREFFDKGFAPFSDSLGAHFGLALGWGLAFKSSGADRVSVCVFGDGAATRGTFHGAMNLSALLGLPILWVCETNQYSVSTPRSLLSAASSFADHAASYRMRSSAVDGNDVLEVCRRVKKELEAVRKDAKPAFIELMTYRMKEHAFGDPDDYRSVSEQERWEKRDPIGMLERKLRALRVADSRSLAAVHEEAFAAVAAII